MATPKGKANPKATPKTGTPTKKGKDRATPTVIPEKTSAAPPSRAKPKETTTAIAANPKATGMNAGVYDQRNNWLSTIKANEILHAAFSKDALTIDAGGTMEPFDEKSAGKRLKMPQGFTKLNDVPLDQLPSFKCGFNVLFFNNFIAPTPGVRIDEQAVDDWVRVNAMKGPPQVGEGLTLAGWTSKPGNFKIEKGALERVSNCEQPLGVLKAAAREASDDFLARG